MWWTLAAFLWFAAWLVTAYSLVSAMRETNRRQAEHAKCVALVSSLASDRIAAMTLLHAADRWDSVEEQPRVQQLIRDEYKMGGPSMPAIWLRHEAERIWQGLEHTRTEEPVS